MAEYHLQAPLKNEDIEQLKLGDTIYISGEVFTCRSRLHKYIFDEGHELPFSTDDRNVLIHNGPIIVKENGEWVQKPYYVIDDQLPYGHGEKSVYMINGYLRLTREEALAINWHMGGFDKRTQAGGNEMSASYYKYPICVLVHLADIMASYLDETRPN